MGAGHDHGQGPPVSRRTVRAAAVVLGLAAAATVAAMIWLWPGERPETERPADVAWAYGEVVAVDTDPCPETPDDAPPGARPGPSGCGTATIAITEGPGTGTEVEAALPAGAGAPTVDVGDALVLRHLPDDATYLISDHQRGTRLWILGAAFALAVIAFGRWRGLSALAGLAVTFGVLLLFVVPAILDGKPPLPVAITGAAAIMLVVLYLTHGVSMTTTIAVAGTLVSLVLTGLLAALATGAAHLTGIADESSNHVSLTYGFDMRGLLLASILIGTLGVLDDVTVTQSVTVGELARANPGYGPRRLYTAATRVGRAHIASVINTIILAYAGASLPVLLLVAAADRPLGEVLTGQAVAQELVRSAVGTIGLIAAVPITTALAALVARRRTETDGTPARPKEPKGEWLGMYGEP
ncbi:YibE/F family protein [Phytomonospora endophytica]|uniref:Putative membrane protein n=1 Tax=Phytomonospora endophytica TaxID=714109 RepID=A0A841FJN8_9ACTN|nr:YibE/F family protein [Phytomonospora endophytica]MBB6036094.1 putative membrane protein [Phytomonospora endophytica]GIG66997.1 hypothetical protein Pen01_32920 [Phytomonospora endophytica]